jgi:ribonucleoside-diphosphate reductase alpha chain
VIHLSNLCTEILEVTSNDETAVCNLGSINLGNHFDEHNEFDFEKLAETVRLAVRQLDRVIDLNFYPIETARRANLRWRPVGLGCMGLQDVFFRKRLPFDSAEAAPCRRRLPKRSTSTRWKPPASWPRNVASTRRSTTPVPPVANCSSTPGTWCRKTPRAGMPCAPASRNTACATR